MSTGKGAGKGNTWGTVSGETPKSAAKAAGANPELDGKNILEKAQEGAKGAIDDWVERQGDNKLAMAAGAISVAVVEVFMPTAWWELVPAGKAAKILKKGAEAAKILKKGDAVADTGQNLNRADKAADAGAAGKADNAGDAGKDAGKADEAGKTKTDGDTQVKKKNTGEKGKCGEWLAKMDMMQEGFDEVVEVQNNSGHGIDLIGRNSKTGEVKVWEVKTTDGASAPSLSKEQASRGGESYTNNRLERAAGGKGNYGKVPEAMANAEKAQDWLDKAKKSGKPAAYEKREVFIDDIEKGCAKNPNKPSKSLPWKPK